MRLEYMPKAIEQLKELPRSVQLRIKEKLDWYSSQTNPLKFAEHLSGHNAFRFRIGMYRVIFEIQNNTLSVLLIGKRDKAYGDL